MLYRNGMKRVLDFSCALLGLIVLSPIILLTAALVRVKLGRPILFCQKRPGKQEKIFSMYKFRSMTSETDEKGKLLPDEVRLTKFGRFLRASSLDELPELWNILKGDMSIVGPRPLLVEYLPLYNETQKHRHDVRPGLTGLAQVNGRNAISWEEKFAYDVQYVKNITFLGDLKILWQTVAKVAKQDSVNTVAGTTMEPFKGSMEKK